MYYGGLMIKLHIWEGAKARYGLYLFGYFSMKKRPCCRCDKTFMPTPKLSRTCEQCYITNTRNQESAEWDTSVRTKGSAKISEMEIEDDV